ncbi:MAG: response regulator transcription factor [Dehalococcoidia bacterium]
MATKVLVVDDEQSIVDLVRGYLEKEAFEVYAAFDGPSALDLARELNPDLVVLDVMLPGVDGIEVCRQLRQFSAAYVLMLTARAEEVDRIVGLTVGADDYLTKPFSPRELVARVRAMLRRPRTAALQDADEVDAPLRLRDLVIDRGRHAVTRDLVPIDLTAREFALLAMLTEQPGRVFTRAQILDRVWASEFYDEHVVEVHLGNLRRKLGGEPARYIQTVRGVGYRAVEGVE